MMMSPLVASRTPCSSCPGHSGALLQLRNHFVSAVLPLSRVSQSQYLRAIGYRDNCRVCSYFSLDFLSLLPLRPNGEDSVASFKLPGETRYHFPRYYDITGSPHYCFTVTQYQPILFRFSCTLIVEMVHHLVAMAYGSSRDLAGVSVFI